MFEIPKHAGCPFCEYIAGVRPCAFVSRNDRVSSFMNRTQYERGGLLVVPNAHRQTILELEVELLGSIYAEAQRLASAMARGLGALGVNVFHNSGVRAGQSIAHFHVHVVPRYESSEPWRSFHEAEFDHKPVEELEEIADVLRSALSA